MNDPRSTPPLRRDPVFVGLFVAIMAWWTLHGLYGRSIVTDDGISLLAARGIREHGYPILPSGLVYARSYLAHYALALSTALFGTNDFGIAASSLVAAGAVLVLVHRLGSEVFLDGETPQGASRSRWIAYVAMVLLAVSPPQVHYAASPRMYGWLTAFAAWTALAGWRGFARGRRDQQAWAVVAVALGIQCERGAATLLPGLVVAGLFVTGGSLRARVQALLERVRPIGPAQLGAAVVLLASLALVAYQPPNALRPIVVMGGQPRDFIQFSLAPDRLFWNLLDVDGMLPGTLAFAVLGVLAGGTGARFLAVVFAVALAQVAALMAYQGQRMVLFLLPLYALLVAAGLRAVVDAARARVLATRPWRLRIEGAVVFHAILIALATFLPKHLGRAYPTAYLFPDHREEGSSDTRRNLRWLAEALGPDDVVLTSNPWITDYYLGRTDGFLRQRREKRKFGPFEEDADEYFGAPIYDEWSDIEAAMKALGPDRTLWLVADHKSEILWSIELRARVQAAFDLVRESENLWIFRTRALASDTTRIEP